MDYPAWSMSRRRALRLGVVATLSLPTALSLRDAAAGRTWCRTDPLLSIGGVRANVYVSGLLDVRYDTSGPIGLVVRVPTGVLGEVLATDSGFGHGYEITFEERAKLRESSERIELEVAVYVPATESGKDQPILVEFVPEDAVEDAEKKAKRTNEWITIKTQLAKS